MTSPYGQSAIDVGIPNVGVVNPAVVDEPDSGVMTRLG